MSGSYGGRGTPQAPARRDAHFPGRAPIDSYGDGGFRFAGMSHRGSLLCLPSGIYGWDVQAGDEVSAAALERVFAEAEEIDQLLLGTGGTLAFPSEALRLACRDVGIGLEAMSTGAAIRTYNILLGEGRRIAAALIVTG